MKQHWKLRLPNLVVSVVGGEGKSKVRSWVREVLRQGLVKAAQSTGVIFSHIILLFIYCSFIFTFIYATIATVLKCWYWSRLFRFPSILVLRTCLLFCPLICEEVCMPCDFLFVDVTWNAWWEKEKCMTTVNLHSDWHYKQLYESYIHLYTNCKPSKAQLPWHKFKMD